MKRSLLLCALSSLVLALAGCGDSLEDSLNDLANDIEAELRAGYNFDACPSATDFSTCNTCCSDGGFTAGAMFNETECGCTTTVTDGEVCADSNADLDTCSACCNDNGSNVSSLSNGECFCTTNSDQPEM